MNITWKGQSCFQILISSRKNGETSLVIDPFDEKIGLKLPKMEADVLLTTHEHPDHNNVKGVGGKPFLISGSGEYEIKEIYILGIPVYHDKSEGKERGQVTAYVIEVEEGLKICHLGDLGQTELTNEQLRSIGDIDILMIPTGGTFTIDSQEALKIINQIEPRIVIPMHYQMPKLNVKLDPLEKFLKAMGAKGIEPQKKLSIKKKDLADEETKVVVLEP